MAGGSLWRNRDFTLLWAGQSVSEVGSQVTMLALPLLATITLHATTFEVALLSVCSSAAFLLVALHAGALVDRMRKKPVLIRADLAREPVPDVVLRQHDRREPRVRLEVVRHLLLRREVPRRRRERHAIETVVARRREEAQRVPPPAPVVADPRLVAEDDEVTIEDGEGKPVKIGILMNNSSGLFQVDGLLKAKLRGSGLEPYVEVVARIDTEAAASAAKPAAAPAKM